MIATKKIERLLKGRLQERQVAATKIQAAYRQHFYRAKWLFALRVIVNCQSTIRRRRAARLTKKLRFIKTQAPKDIFKFIKMRQEATSVIQTVYQQYAMRNFDLSYHNYVRRLHQVAENPSSNESQPPPHEAEHLPLNQVSFCSPTVESSKPSSKNLDTDIYDLLLEESPNRRSEEEGVSTSVKEMDSDVSGLEGEIPVADDTPSYVAEGDLNLKSSSWKYSRCGLSDQVHDILLQSGKWFYDKLGDPGEDTAEDLITVMEISEEAAFCCWKKDITGRTTTSVMEVRTRENQDEVSSAIAIQSQWRRYNASTHFEKIVLRNIFDKLNNDDACHQYNGRCALSGVKEPLTQADENVIPSQSLASITHRSGIIPRVNMFEEAFATSAIIRCQRAVRRFIASRHLEKFMSERQSSITKNAHSPDRKHVGRAGQIEIILNEEMDEDATLTDYSETESSDGEVQDDLIVDGTLNNSEMIDNMALLSPIQFPTSEHEHELGCNLTNSSDLLSCCDEVHHTKIISNRVICAESNTLLNTETLSHKPENTSIREDVTSHAKCFLMMSSSPLPQVREDTTKAELQTNLSAICDEISVIFEPDLRLPTFSQEIRQEADTIHCISMQNSSTAISGTETVTLPQLNRDDSSCLSDVSDTMKFQSKFFDHSRCGFSDNLHELLIESGKWIYDRVGDPGEDTAEKLVTAMEISEEAAFCCWSPVPREITEF